MKRPFFTRQILVVLLCLVTSVTWAANTKTTVSQVTSSVTVAANTDYVITGTTPFGNQGSINIPSASMEHSVIIFQNIKPSVVISSWLSRVKINGATANNGSNCQVRMYNKGAIVLPYGADFSPLTCYSGANFTGTSCNTYTTGSNGGYMKTLTEATLLNSIRSFKLKRGYMVTFATGTAGWGYSRCFIADTEDLEIDLASVTSGQVLNGKVSSYRLFQWFNFGKTGLANNVDATACSALNVQGCYNFNVGEDRLPDVESIPHKIHRNWPGVAACGEKEYSAHMKTDNEPANSNDDEPATVDQVLAYWQDAMRTGMRLCSPSSHDGGYTWQEEFMKEIDKRGWRCDILDMHCYWAEGFSGLTSYYSKYGRPIWVTEWIWGASWNTNGAFASGVTDSQIISNTSSILNTLNTTAAVERHFYWNSESKAKIYNNGITSLGEVFAASDGGLGYDKSKEFVPVVVIKAPYSLMGSTGTSSITLNWSDPNGDMMDEIRVQYKTSAASSWNTLGTVNRRDKTGSSDQSYSYTGTISNPASYQWRVVDVYEGTLYASNTLTFTGALTESPRYLYNEETGMFLGAGNSWGTQASLLTTGTDLTLETVSDGYALNTNISNGGTSNYLGTNLYMDSGTATWTITESGTATNGNKTYTLTHNGTNYLATNGSGAALTTITDATSARCKWQMLTKSDLIERMYGATEASPIDATFLLPGFNFSRNDGRNAYWNNSPTIGGEATNMNGEKYNTTFDVYQELTGVPNGTYRISAQGFYRDGGYANAATKHANGTETLNAEFYANDVTRPVPSIFDGAGKNGTTGVNTSQGYIPNGQGDASNYLTNGLYAITPIRVTVTDGTLRIGIRKSVAVENDWTVFDNFSLTYLGGSEQPEDTRYPTALAAAQAARDANETSQAGAAQAALDQYEWTDAERATKSDDEIEAAITVLTNAATISNAGQVATGLIQNANFKGGTSSATASGGGRVEYPTGWSFIHELAGWNDCYVDTGNGIFNAWAGTITHAELYQALAGLPNGAYRLTADVRVDTEAALSQTALYGTGSLTGRSEEAGSDISGGTEAFASYSCAFEVTDNTCTIGIRSNHSFYQIKNIALEYVTDTIQAAREVADSRLRQEFFWSTDLFFDAAASADYANASDVLVYPRLANQLIKATSARQFRHQTNVIVNGTCQNLVITDEQPLSIPEPFTAATLTYDRNDAADGWRELFVPFAVPKSNGLDVGIITGFSITEGDDVTLTNASFDTGTAVSGNQAATDPGTNGNVDGWTLSGSCGWSTSGLFAYGSGAQLNGSTVPTSGPTGSASTQGLGISVGWGNTVIYSQTVSALPAGDYVLSCKEYNVFNVTQMRSLFGVIVGDGSHLSEKTSFASGTWETETISFTLTEAADVTIQVGAQAVGGGSTSNAKVLFDDVMLMGRTPLSLTATGEKLTTTAPNVPSVVKFTDPVISLTDVSVVPAVEYSDNDGLHGIYTAGHHVSPLRWYIDPGHRLSEFALSLTLPFDVEEDGELNRLDVVKLATILVNGLQGDYRLSVLDVDGNGHFSLSDITALVNLIRQQ